MSFACQNKLCAETDGISIGQQAISVGSFWKVKGQFLSTVSVSCQKQNIASLFC